MLKSFKELIAYLALACILVLAASFVSGCASTSPQSVAYKATDAVITTVDQAIAAWSDHVVAQEKINAAITDPIARAEAGTALLNAEGKVSAAYYNYQKAASAAIKAGAAASSGAAGDVVTAASQFIGIITSLLH